jgi:hypothetical protein
MAQTVDVLLLDPVQKFSRQVFSRFSYFWVGLPPFLLCLLHLKNPCGLVIDINNGKTFMEGTAWERFHPSLFPLW